KPLRPWPVRAVQLLRRLRGGRRPGLPQPVHRRGPPDYRLRLRPYRPVHRARAGRQPQRPRGADPSGRRQDPERQSQTSVRSVSMAASTQFQLFVDSLRELWSEGLPPEEHWAKVKEIMSPLLADEELQRRSESWPVTTGTNLLFYEDP